MARVAFPLVLQSPSSGSAIVGATATITVHAPGGAIGSGSAATIFLSETGGSAVAGNRITTDNLGRWTQGAGASYAQYWLTEGTYDIAISGSGLTGYTITRELISGQHGLAGALGNALDYEEGLLAGLPPATGAGAAPLGYEYQATNVAQLLKNITGTWQIIEQVGNKGVTGGYPGMYAGASSGFATPAFYRLGLETDTRIVKFDTGTYWAPLNMTVLPVPSGNATAEAGQILQMNSAPSTGFLPASPQPGWVCGVAAGTPLTVTGANPITVGGNGNSIFLPGVAGVSNFKLGVGFGFWLGIWTGLNWQTIGGRDDTGWVALTLGTNVIAGDNITPSVRLRGDEVTFKGTLFANSSISANATLATVPANFRPPTGSFTTTPFAEVANHPSPSAIYVNNSTGVVNCLNALSFGEIIPLNGASYATD